MLAVLHSRATLSSAWNSVTPGAYHVAQLLHSPEGVERLPLGALHQKRHQSVSPEVVWARLCAPAKADLEISAAGQLMRRGRSDAGSLQQADKAHNSLRRRGKTDPKAWGARS